jgi:hypothetical protein
MSETIRIKPHHFIDIIRDYGADEVSLEPHPYGHAVHLVAARIVSDPDTPLVMDLGADDICQPCRHNIEGLCDDTIEARFGRGVPISKREYNLALDERWCERLGLAQGDRLTAREFCQRLSEAAGDITDLYPEHPPADTAARQQSIRAGIAKVLGST